MHPTPFPWFRLFQLVVVGFAIWFLYQTWQLWLLVLSALILAAAMLPAARWAERRRIPRTVTVITIYLAVAVVLAVLGGFLVPAVAEQGREFLRQVPALLANLRGWFGALSRLGGEWAVPLPSPENWEQLGPALVENTLRATAGVVGGALGLLLVLFLAAYLVVDGDRISRGLLALVPPTAHARVAALTETVLDRMGAYVRGQIIASGCVGVVLGVGLSLLGVPYALLIGGLAAALNVIPFVGATIASVLGILTALNLSFWLALWTALLFWGTNLVEGKVLVPQLVGRATGLHPLAVMLALLAGAKLAGLVGALVAVPLLAGGWEILRALWIAPMQDEEAAVGRSGSDATSAELMQARRRRIHHQQ
jgi:predicted PurR-regulated permease PerM